MNENQRHAGKQRLEPNFWGICNPYCNGVDHRKGSPKNLPGNPSYASLERPVTRTGALFGAFVRFMGALNTTVNTKIS